MTAAARRVDTARAGMAIGMATVSAPRPLVGTIMMTGGEATVRLRAADRRPWMTTRPRAAMMTPTAAALGTILLPRIRT
jgi:hypothetical protein